MATTATAPAPASKRRVRVWFGEHTIMDRTYPPSVAERYECAMRRRFASLRVTNDPAGTDVSQTAESSR